MLAIAQEHQATAGEVAIAWVMAKGVLPILGPRTPEQLMGNLSATRLVLSDDQMRRLDSASAVPLGFPHEVVAANIGSLFGGKADLVDRRVPGVR